MDLLVKLEICVSEGDDRLGARFKHSDWSHFDTTTHGTSFGYCKVARLSCVVGLARILGIMGDPGVHCVYE